MTKTVGYKKRYQKRKSKVPVSKAVKKYVKKALDERVENKLAVFQNTLAGVTVTNSTTLGLVQNLLPIVQTGAEFCDRVGNKLRPKKLLYTGHISRSSINSASTPQITQLVILRLRNTYDQPALADMNLLKFQNTSTGTPSMGGIASIDYRTLLSPFNRDVFDIKMVKTFKIGNANPSLSFVNNDYNITADFNIDLTRFVKKRWTYANSINNLPENEGLYAFWFAVNIDSSALFANEINLETISSMYYEDA